MDIDRSTIWPYKDGEPGEFIYQRYGHPAGVEAERRLGELDGGHALLFASGSRRDDGTRAHLPLLRRRRSRSPRAPTSEPASSSASSNAGDYVSSSSTRPARRRTASTSSGSRLRRIPSSRCPTSRPRRRIRHRVVVDATAATPIYLRPLEHGVDFVLHSATKYLGGHDDVLLGAVVCKREDDAERLKEFRTRSGIVAAPDPCALLLRGLETLEERVRRQTESATELARRLQGHPAVQIVRYAGIGGLLSFDVAGADEARHVETSLRLITNATSLGGIHSLLEARARWEGDRVPPGLLRLSVGLEPVEDIWADLAQALEIPGNFPAHE